MQVRHGLLHCGILKLRKQHPSIHSKEEFIHPYETQHREASIGIEEAKTGGAIHQAIHQNGMFVGEHPMTSVASFVSCFECMR